MDLCDPSERASILRQPSSSHYRDAHLRGKHIESLFKSFNPNNNSSFNRHFPIIKQDQAALRLQLLLSN